MSEHFPHTTDASRRLVYLLRCYWCEVLSSWALKVAPKGYVPVVIHLTAKAAIVKHMTRLPGEDTLPQADKP